VEGISKPGVWAQVLLALVQNGSMDQNQITWIATLEHILASRRRGLFSGYRQLFEACPACWETDKPFRDGGCRVRSGEEREGPVFCSTLFEGNPKPEGRRRIGVQERRVVVFWDFSTDFLLFRDDHGLECHRIAMKLQVLNEVFDTLVFQGHFPEQWVKFV